MHTPNKRNKDIHDIVFYYGQQVPAVALQEFSVAVLDPDSSHDPAHGSLSRTLSLAYLSIGEVLASRKFFSAMPVAWFLGTNHDWQSSIVDQTASGWPEFLVREIASPYWQAGYRGFFLDTMDSYQIPVMDTAERQRQRQGLIRAVSALRQSFPDALILVNRGFEVLDALHRKIDGLVFESLYAAWDQANLRYTDVPASDRQWLLGQASRARALNLPVISVDYCEPDDHEQKHRVRCQIESHGIVPYVADGHLLTLPGVLAV